MENSENNENKCVCTNQGEWQYKSHIILIQAAVFRQQVHLDGKLGGLLLQIGRAHV